MTAVTTTRAGTARRTWGVSVVATVVSTYALDLIATAAGVALVATGLLAGLAQEWLLTLLVASYAAWGLGLRTNVRANSALLATTGLSTNVISKAAFDLARRLSGSVRAQRWAAATGYVGTEVIKEAPYYLSAFGVAVVSDPITSDEALVFLAGANVGAMVYEYGVARLTHGFLRHRAAPGHPALAGFGRRRRLRIASVCSSAVTANDDVKGNSRSWATIRPRTPRASPAWRCGRSCCRR
jgi:hypothetical protein